VQSFGFEICSKIAKDKIYKNIILEGTSDATEKILFHSPIILDGLGFPKNGSLGLIGLGSRAYFFNGP
jgi:hypothetical protein